MKLLILVLILGLSGCKSSSVKISNSKPAATKNIGATNSPRLIFKVVSDEEPIAKAQELPAPKVSQNSVQPVSKPSSSPKGAEKINETKINIEVSKPQGSEPQAVISVKKSSLFYFYYCLVVVAVGYVFRTEFKEIGLKFWRFLRMEGPVPLPEPEIPIPPVRLKESENFEVPKI